MEGVVHGHLFLFMDIVFPLGGGSKIDDLELRYSLRSIEKHISGVRDIYLIGKKPEWVKDVYHIEAEDEHPCKETNIYRKVMIACQKPDISDNFLFFNDDHFIIHDFEADKFPSFYKGHLLQVLGKMPPYNKYSTCVYQTAMVLRERGFKEDNYDAHCPIIYNKQKFAEVMPTYDWSHRFSFVVKSLYANSVGVAGVKEPDCKINDPASHEEFKRRLQDRKFFSVGNDAIAQGWHDTMKELYPNPSRWEIVK